MSNNFALSRPKPKLSFFIFFVTVTFLLLPLIILVPYSFNDAKNVWTHFSLRWYKILFIKKHLIWLAFYRSMLVAALSGVISTVIGVLLAIGLKWYNFALKPYIRSLIFLSLVLPDIVLGLGLAILISVLKLNLGLLNVIFAHISFCIPFVTLIVFARLDEFDDSILEVAHDLGANEWQRLIYVILPIASPGIVSAFVTAVTLSLEDFVITIFVGSSGTTTLPIAINNAIRKDPDSNVVYALSVLLILFTVLFAVFLRNFLKYLVKR